MEVGDDFGGMSEFGGGEPLSGDNPTPDQLQNLWSSKTGTPEPGTDIKPVSIF